MFVKKIANYNSRLPVGKNTVIRKVEGSCGYIFTESGYKGFTRNDVKAADFTSGRIMKKYPESLETIWINEEIAEPAVISRYRFLSREFTDCYADMEILYQIRVDRETPGFDGTNVKNLFRRVFELAKKDIDFDPTIGADGDHGIVTIPDDYVSAELARHVSDCFRDAVFQFSSVREFCEDIRLRCLELAATDPFILNYGIHIAAVKIRFDLQSSELLIRKRRESQEEIDFLQADVESGAVRLEFENIRSRQEAKAEIERMKTESEKRRAARIYSGI